MTGNDNNILPFQQYNYLSSHTNKTNRMRTLTKIAAGCLLLLSSCAPARVAYIGRNYTPTTQVDLFFNTKDVKKPFEVMGKVNSEDYAFRDPQKIQEKIMTEARKRGADAVIISNFNEADVAQTVYEKKEGTVTATSGDVPSGMRYVRADFIKYK